MDKFRKGVEDVVSDMSYKAKVLFAVLTAERLYPNYVFFRRRNGWGNEKFLQDGLSIIYQYIIRADLFDLVEIKEAINNIDDVTPDTADFSHITASFALDACTAISSTLSFLIDKDDMNVVDVAVFARDTVDMFIQEKLDISSSDKLIETKISNDPYMINHMSYQESLLERLRTMDLNFVTDELIGSLRGKDAIIDLAIFEV